MPLVLFAELFQRTRPHLLIEHSQHLRLRRDCQARVQQRAATTRPAQMPQPGRSRMMGQVDLRRVLDRQYDGMLPTTLDRAGHVWLENILPANGPFSHSR